MANFIALTRAAILLILAAVLAPLAQAQVTLDAASVQPGLRMSWGQCPCFRWSLRVQMISGRWVTRDFYISTDALLRLNQTSDYQFHRMTSRTISLGAMEALWRGQHLGVAFSGVTWGDDIDRGMANLLNTGAYLILNVLLDDAARLDIRTGYDFERMRLNAVIPVERHRASESLHLRWDTGDFRGNAWATVFIDGNYPFDPQYTAFRAGLRLEGRPIVISHFAAGLGFEGFYEHDPLRELFGLEPHHISGQLYLDISFAPQIADRTREEDDHEAPR